ncbi:MAG: fibronectin type III domain-containing protein, partial [Legionella sp.]|nr:fibronectin type III domain-containing protein [Legionella sp.]
GHETINPSTVVTVNAGTSQQFTVTPNSGYTLSTTVGGTCTQGSWIGNTYTTGAITSNCTVIFSATVFAAAAGPTNVIATPGSTQVTVSWTAPTNTGGGAITGYTVTYAISSTDSPYTLVGCSVAAPQTSCTVTGLSNSTPYTFAVTTQTLIGVVTQTGYASYSSSVTPKSLTENPSLLALLSNGQTRNVTVTNNTNSQVSIDSVTGFSPLLPGTASSSTTCTAGMILNAGEQCIVTIIPGSTASSDCTTGANPTLSTMTIQASISGVDLPPNTIQAVIVDKGCKYQGGYLFSFDDNTPANTSIGGTVVALTDMVSPGLDFHWSPSPAPTNNSIWGIDDQSTTLIPSPESSSSEPAQFQANQLNCDGMDDGTCNSHNVMVYPGYGYNNAYAVGICSFFPISDGSIYYVGSYLPSLCEMDSGANGFSNCTPGTASIGDLSIPIGLSGNYWSSTEYSLFPKDQAWTISFPITSNSQSPLTKINIPASSPGVRCAHKVTI